MLTKYHNESQAIDSRGARMIETMRREEMGRKENPLEMVDRWKKTRYSKMHCSNGHFIKSSLPWYNGGFSFV
ncbi:hypothetical protein TNCV_2732431 [Trichonephila clavipes]|nr:hypothetical protein TNCV_2732431 [Trichonephila clavipes]